VLADVIAKKPELPLCGINLMKKQMRIDFFSNEAFSGLKNQHLWKYLTNNLKQPTSRFSKTSGNSTKGSNAQTTGEQQKLDVLFLNIRPRGSRK